MKIFGKRIVIIGSACLLAVVLVYAQQQQPSRSELEKRKAGILREISATQQMLKATQKDKNASMGQLRALQAKLAQRQSLINTINQETAQIDNGIASNLSQIDKLTKEISVLKASYARSVRYAYKNQSAENVLAFVVSADNFNDAMRRYQYMKKSRDFRQSQAGKLKGSQQLFAKNVGQLKANKQQKLELRSVEERERAQLADETTQTNALVAELRGKEQDLSGQIAKKRADARQLDNTIKAAIKKEIEIARAKAAEEMRVKLALEAKKKAEAEAARLKAAEEQALAAAAAKRQAAEQAALKAKRDADEKRKADALATANSPAANTSAEAPTRTYERPATGPASTKPANPKTTPKVAATLPAAKPAAVEPPKPVAPPEKPSYKLSLTPEVQQLSASFSANRGRLPWPVAQGYIALPFGNYKHPLEPKVTLNNSGIDIASSAGSSVRCVFGGTVSRVVNIAGSYTVILNHGEYFTVYSYLKSASVSAGQKLTANQNIGVVGVNDDGEHVVHFEICKINSNNSISNENPASWIAR